MNNFIEKTKLFDAQINLILELIKPLKAGSGRVLSKNKPSGLGIVLIKNKSNVLTLNDIKYYFSEILVKSNIRYKVSEDENSFYVGKPHDAKSIEAMQKAGWGKIKSP